MSLRAIFPVGITNLQLNGLLENGERYGAFRLGSLGMHKSSVAFVGLPSSWGHLQKIPASFREQMSARRAATQLVIRALSKASRRGRGVVMQSDGVSWSMDQTNSGGNRPRCDSNDCDRRNRTGVTRSRVTATAIGASIGSGDRAASSRRSPEAEVGS